MLRPQKPITYLITSGKTTPQTTSSSPEFQNILELVRAAVEAGIDLLQLREKSLTTRVLTELAERAVRVTKDSDTLLLVNDRADVAAATGADGVHLTSQSVSADVIRRAFGGDIIIGASTHSLAEAEAVRPHADFVVFGPVFPTPSKINWGTPLGLEHLKVVCAKLDPLPVLAVGGVDETNFKDCVQAGASGVAAIRMFADGGKLKSIVGSMRQTFQHS